MRKRVLTGIAGVHFVVGELSRHGWIALPTIRNTAGIDILAQKGDRSIQLQVKTSSVRCVRWVLNKSAEELDSPNLYYVFVGLCGLEQPEYFIVPSAIVADYVTRDHKLFREAGGRENPMRTFGQGGKYAPYQFDLERHKDNWGILEQSRKE